MISRIRSLQGMRTTRLLHRGYCSAQQDLKDNEEPPALEDITKTVLKVTLDPAIDKMMEEGMKGRHHPGVRKMVNQLPAFLEMSAKKTLQRYNSNKFQNDMLKLHRAVHHYEMPVGPEELGEKERMINERIRSEEDAKYDMTILSEEEKEFVEMRREKRKKLLMAKPSVTWRNVEYNDHYKAAVYLGGRLSPNYATLSYVFQEIKRTYPAFAPKTLFDFGSGIGTVMFAANEMWPNSFSEHFNVDVSSSMNDMSRLLLQGGDETKPMIYNGVYHRQYLPLSSEIKYDLVTSAFTMLEMPSRASRLQTIENLWAKTSDLFVMLEHGTTHGFAAINEARNLILKLSGYDPTKSYYINPSDIEVANYDPLKAPTGHILSPCTHQFSCPRLHTGGPVKCNFNVNFLPLSIGQKTISTKEYFSYIVFKKGPKEPMDHPQWARVVQPILHRHKHSICRLCCPDGRIHSCTITKGKSTPHLYKVGKVSQWGDLLPVTVEEMDRPLSFWDRMKRQKKQMEADGDESDDK